VSHRLKWREATALWVILLSAALACTQGRQEPKPPADKRPVRQRQTQSVDSAGPRNDIPGLGNFAKVTDALYRGAQPSREGFIQLKAMGIKTIVDLRDHHSDIENLRGLGFRYAQVPCESLRPEETNVLAFLKIVTSLDNQPVFVHCMHGSDRTGMMVACYRMVVQGWDRQDSMAELPNYGFHNIWLDIRIFLQNMDPQAMAQQLAHCSDPPIEAVP
jgi:tyrosine-protein phosphatase SIW14